MKLLARIMSHGFAVALVVLLAIGFVYRGELFPEWELPDFLVLDSAGSTADDTLTSKVEPAPIQDDWMSPGQAVENQQASEVEDETATTIAVEADVIPSDVDVSESSASVTAPSGENDVVAASEVPMQLTPAVVENEMPTPIPTGQEPADNVEDEAIATIAVEADAIPSEVDVTEPSASVSAPSGETDFVGASELQMPLTPAVVENEAPASIPMKQLAEQGIQAPVVETSADGQMDIDNQAAAASAVVATAIDDGLDRQSSVIVDVTTDSAAPQPETVSADPVSDVADSVVVMKDAASTPSGIVPVEVTEPSESDSEAVAAPVTTKRETTVSSAVSAAPVVAGVDEGAVTEPAALDPAPQIDLDVTMSSYQLLASAREAYWLRDYQGAEDFYRRMIMDDPYNPDGYGELANMYFSQGDWEAASSAYYEAGLRLVKSGLLAPASELVDVIRGLNGSQADVLEQAIQKSREASQ